MPRMATLGITAVFIVIFNVNAWADMRYVHFPREGFKLKLPQKWIKVPEDVFHNKMKSIKENYDQEKANKYINYDYALQLKSKDWFEYPYLFISVWKDTRVQEQEIPKMNNKLEQNMLQGQAGIKDPELVRSIYNPQRHLYRAELRFNIAKKSMVLIKAVCYMDQGILVLSTYMPEEMYFEYAPDIKKALDNLKLSPENIYRARPNQGLEFKKDILPYLKILIAVVIVIVLVGIYFLNRQRNE